MKNYPKERLVKLIIYEEKSQEVTKENCVKELINGIKYSLNLSLDQKFLQFESESLDYLAKQ